MARESVKLSDETRSKFEKQIEMYEQAIKALESFKAIAEQFSGKVYNKRFREALKDAANAVRKYAYISEKCDTYYSKENNYSGRTYIAFELGWGGTDAECHSFGIGLWSNDPHFIEYPDKRIDTATFCAAVDDVITRVKSRKAEYEESIKVFDEVAKKYKEMSDAWKEFAATIPQPIRPYVHSDEMGYFGYFGI
jgi:tetratricopeptide (TPR) repeat protein